MKVHKDPVLFFWADWTGNMQVSPTVCRISWFYVFLSSYRIVPLLLPVRLRATAIVTSCTATWMAAHPAHLLSRGRPMVRRSGATFLPLLLHPHRTVLVTPLAFVLQLQNFIVLSKIFPMAPVYHPVCDITLVKQQFCIHICFYWFDAVDLFFLWITCLVITRTLVCFFPQNITLANTVSDPVIEEHFRRSLGKNYKEGEPVSNSVSITGSVDDHFAKALGDAWLQIKAKGGGHQTSESDPWGRREETLQSLP